MEHLDTFLARHPPFDRIDAAELHDGDALQRQVVTGDVGCAGQRSGPGDNGAGRHHQGDSAHDAEGRGLEAEGIELLPDEVELRRKVLEDERQHPITRAQGVLHVGKLALLP